MTRGANKIRESADKRSTDKRKLLVRSLGTCVEELFVDSLDQAKEMVGDEAKNASGAPNIPPLKRKKILGG